MPNFEPESKRISFKLSTQERDLIVNKSIAVYPAIIEQLRFGVHEGKHMTFALHPEDFEDLVDGLASEANHATSRKIRRQFARLCDRLEEVLGEMRDGYGFLSTFVLFRFFHTL